MITDDRPDACCELDEGDLPAGQVLLVADIPIAGDQDIEPGFLRLADERTVLEGGPAHASGRDDLITGEGASKAERRILIKQDSRGWHAAWHTR